MAGQRKAQRSAAEGDSVVVADVQAGLGFGLATRGRGDYVECDVSERDAWVQALHADLVQPDGTATSATEATP